MKILYPVKHWVTTLLLGPVLLMGYHPFTSSRIIRNAHGIIVLFWGLGFVLSLPVFAMYLLAFKFIIKRKKSDLVIKTALGILGVVSIAVIFLLIIKGSTAMELTMSYSISLITSSLFLRIENRELELREQIE